MPTNSRNQEPGLIKVESALAGILALLIDEREQRTKDDKGAARTEILLANAGLSIDEVAAAMGRNYDTVRMAIARGRARKKR